MAKAHIFSIFFRACWVSKKQSTNISTQQGPQYRKGEKERRLYFHKNQSMHNRKTKYKRHKYICVVCTLASGYALLKNTYAHFKRARKLIKLRNHNLQDDVLCKPCYHQHIDIRGYQNINTSSIQGSQDSFETCPRCGGTVSTKQLFQCIPICFIEFIQNFKLL